MYSREKGDQKTHFGTTGYTMDRTFVLFDRESDSIWYPNKNGALRAVSGPRKGETIPTAAKTEIMRLSQWLEIHPESKVLMPSPISKTVHRVAIDARK